MFNKTNYKNSIAVFYIVYGWINQNLHALSMVFRVDQMWIKDFKFTLKKWPLLAIWELVSVWMCTSICVCLSYTLCYCSLKSKGAIFWSHMLQFMSVTSENLVA